MVIVEKHIGKQVYQYNVEWDKEKKKQVWQYIGKKITNNVDSYKHRLNEIIDKFNEQEAKEFLELVEKISKGRFEDASASAKL